MKIIKILIALLLIAPAASATDKIQILKQIADVYTELNTPTEQLQMSRKIDEALKKQCQYVVYGYWEDNEPIWDGYLIGVIDGMLFLMKDSDKTDFAKKSTWGTMKATACKAALSNGSTNGFRFDYRLQLALLINKNHHTLLRKKP